MFHPGSEVKAVIYQYHVLYCYVIYQRVRAGVCLLLLLHHPVHIT